jgi:hypothetical protein
VHVPLTDDQLELMASQSGLYGVRKAAAAYAREVLAASTAPAQSAEQDERAQFRALVCCEVGLSTERSDEEILNALVAQRVQLRRQARAASTAPAQSCGDAEQSAVQQAKIAPFVMSLHDVVEMWNSVIADSFEDELIEFAAKAINFYKDSLPGSAAPNVAEQADEAVTLPYVERFRESHGEGGGVYPDDEGDYMRYSDFVELFASRAKDSK